MDKISVEISETVFFRGIGLKGNAEISNLEDTWLPRNSVKGLNILNHASAWCTTPESTKILDHLTKAGAHVRQNEFNVLSTALTRPTRKGQRNYGLEWVLDNFPTWDVDLSGSKGYSPLVMMSFSENLPLIRRLVDSHGWDVSFPFSPLKLDTLFFVCMANGGFDREVAEYIYEEMERKRSNVINDKGAHEKSSLEWTVNDRSQMSGQAYYGVTAFCWITGQPEQ